MRSACTLLLFLISAAARAELTVFAGVEYFNWQEATTPSVQETGPLLAGGLIWIQDKERGLLFGYRGEIYFGQANYNGADLFTGAPATANVEYSGVLNEGQLRYRFPLQSNEHLDAVLAAGADIWRRQSPGNQMEDWGVVYARLGVELGPRPGKPGWLGVVGLKYPVYTHENAHLTDIGFDQNPKGQAKNPFNARKTDLLEQMYRGSDLAEGVHEGLETRRQMSAERQEEMVASGRGAVNPAGFEQEGRRMARIMAANPNYAVGFVDVGGWDTHVNQGAARGALSDRMRGLGIGLAGFAEEMGDAWRNTVLIVISEFGRTFRENGDRGTDHGHGTVVWVLGGGISGGCTAGEQIGVSAGTLFQDRDLPVLNEYRSLLGYVFTRLYALNASNLAFVFPGAAPGRYSFL